MRFLRYLLLFIILMGICLISLLYWDYKGIVVKPSNNLFAQISHTSCHGKAQDVHIAYITDENYLYPTQVSAYSAIQNKCPESNYYFHIITVDVDSKQANSFFQPLAQPNIHFEIISQTQLIDKEFPKFLKHISAAALLKLALPSILTNLDRVIYLDSDTLVMKDLSELYTTDLDYFVMGAVSDIGIIAQSYLKNFGYQEPAYYNAGMLLLNLNQMRQEKISEQLINYVQKVKGLTFLEQDAINIVLKKRIKPLAYKFNCAAILHLEGRTPQSFWQYLKERFSRKPKNVSNFLKLHKNELPFLWRHMFKEVVIYHYFGPSKPWKTSIKRPQIKLYFDLWHKYAHQLEQKKKASHP